MSKEPKAAFFIRMNGCGHCENMKGDWNKASTNVKGGKIDVQMFEKDETDKINAFEEKHGIQKGGIKHEGYPTLGRIEQNGKITYHNGGRDAATLTNFISGKTVGGKRKTKKNKNQRGTRKNNNRRKSLGNWLNKLFLNK